VREVLETFSIKEGRLEIIPLQWKLKIEKRFKRRLREDPTSRQKVGLLVRVCAYSRQTLNPPWPMPRNKRTPSSSLHDITFAPCDR
jgi:hypothetical protein